MTTFERKQIIDRRNHIRRMHELCITRAMEMQNENAFRKAERFWALANRLHCELGEIIERLGFRW